MYMSCTYLVYDDLLNFILHLFYIVEKVYISIVVPANQRHSKPNSELTITLVVVFLLVISMAILGLIARRKWGTLSKINNKNAKTVPYIKKWKEEKNYKLFLNNFKRKMIVVIHQLASMFKKLKNYLYAMGKNYERKDSLSFENADSYIQWNLTFQ